MKKKVLFLISISVFHVVAVLLMLLGGYMFAKGLVNLHGIKNKVSLEELTLDNLKKGVYIEDDVYSLIGTYPDAGYGTVFFGMSSTQSVGGGLWYNIYTVPIGAKTEEYIMVAVRDVAELTDCWNELTDKPAISPVRLFGKIIPNKYSVNEPWHLQAFGLEDDSVLKSMISYDFCIDVVDEKKESSLWYKGLSLMFTGGFIWFMCNRKWGKAFWLEINKKEDNDSGNEKGNSKKNYI